MPELPKFGSPGVPKPPISPEKEVGGVGMKGGLEGMEQETLKRMGGGLRRRSNQMVMYIPQRGSPEFYPEKEIGRPDETSEVEIKRVPSKEELQKLPKTVLLRIAIELDPDRVSESYQEGWTKEDILKVIEDHVRSALGNQSIEGWPYVGDVEIIDSEIAEKQYPEAPSPYEEL